MKTTCFAFTGALICALTVARAQNSWTNRYNGPGNNQDQATAIAVDGGGNVFVTGRSYSGSQWQSSDYATIKYSNDGVPLWTNRYNGNGGIALAIAVESSGNVFVTGSPATIKYSNAGVPLWTNLWSDLYTGGNARAIAVDGNGNVIVAGVWGGGGNLNYGTIKYSNSGLLLWTNRFFGYNNAFMGSGATAIALDASGNVFVTGGSSDGINNGWNDYVTIKYSNGGVPLWTNRYDGPGNYNDEAAAIAVDVGGNVFVTGASGDNGNNYATIKYSNNGVALWTNRYDGGGASAVALDDSGNVFVTGRGATIKYSNNGLSLWTNRYAYNEEGAAIGLDTSGNVFVTGGSANVGIDYATIKYSNAGLPLWTNRMGGGVAVAIAVDANSNVFVTGHSGDSAGSDYATVKYASAPISKIAALENPQVNSSEFSFNLIAEPSGQFAIQASTNLVNWEVVRQVIVPTGGSTNVTETLLPVTGQKYYRAQRQ